MNDTERLTIRNTLLADEDLGLTAAQATHASWLLAPKVETLLAARVAAARADERAKVAVVLDALDRTESRFRAAIAGKPVRDMAETLAENANARQIALRAAVAASEPEPGA